MLKQTNSMVKANAKANTKAHLQRLMLKQTKSMAKANAKANAAKTIHKC